MIKVGHKNRYVWFAAAVLWMMLIFHFSNQKAVQSSEVSGIFTYRAAEGINEMFHFAWNEDTIAEIAQMLEYPVRKAAHMTEYAILAWIFLGNCMQYPRLRQRSYLWAWILAVIYAASDEFHQLFIEGRSSECMDVVIDGAGALLGLFAAWIALSIYHSKMSKRKR